MRNMTRSSTTKRKRDLKVFKKKKTNTEEKQRRKAELWVKDYDYNV